MVLHIVQPLYLGWLHLLGLHLIPQHLGRIHFVYILVVDDAWLDLRNCCWVSTELYLVLVRVLALVISHSEDDLHFDLFKSH